VDDEQTWEDQQDTLDYRQWKAEQDAERNNISEEESVVMSRARYAAMAAEIEARKAIADMQRMAMQEWGAERDKRIEELRAQVAAWQINDEVQNDKINALQAQLAERVPAPQPLPKRFSPDDFPPLPAEFVQLREDNARAVEALAREQTIAPQPAPSVPDEVKGMIRLALKRMREITASGLHAHLVGQDIAKLEMQQIDAALAWLYSMGEGE
jgi:hypothetical protein